MRMKRAIVIAPWMMAMLSPTLPGRPRFPARSRRRERVPDLAVEGDELVDPRRLVRARPRSVPRLAREGARCPGSRASRPGTGRRRPRRR